MRHKIPREARDLTRYVPDDRKEEYLKAVTAVSYGFPFEACATRIAEILYCTPLLLMLMNALVDLFDGIYSVEDDNELYYTNGDNVKKSYPDLLIEHAENLRILRHADIEVTIPRFDDNGRLESDEEEEEEFNVEDEEEEDFVDSGHNTSFELPDSSDEEEEEEEEEEEPI